MKRHSVPAETVQACIPVMKLEGHEKLPAVPIWDVYEAFATLWRVSDAHFMCMAMMHLPEAELVSKDGLEDCCFAFKLENHEESSKVPW